MKLGAVRNSLSYCADEHRACTGWVQTYFKDCLCNTRDDLSFAFGLLSLFFWGVAEIPQIITNFRTKSGHGISLAFLLTWIAGDVFNLVGCVLEPATLPTQYYTAVLYTSTTVLLVLQSIYYDCFRKKMRCGQVQESIEEVEDLKKPLRPSKPNAYPIPIPNQARGGDTYYYASARSLAGSMTPPIRSYLWPIKSGPSALGIENDWSSDDEASPNLNPSSIPDRKTVSKPKPILRAAGYGAFLATSMNMPRETSAIIVQAYVGFTGRKLLQEHGSESMYGQLMGWMMAAIYMGGRIPQIWLNIKRGNVEGLNPLMFIFAIVANATYTASILVRSTAWYKIKPNLAWLLDAAVCVLLDICIILQYVYYRYFRKDSRGNKQEYGDYKQ